ncbi:MAG TPA: TonB-dependent receptor [Bacteroidia bacterium]
MRRILFLGLLLLAYSNIVVSQSDILGRKISCKIKQKSIPEILKEIESKAGVSFNYNLKIIPDGKYNLNAKNEELNVVLVKLLTPHKLVFSLLYGNYIVINKSEKTDKFTISGYVFDETSGEKLIGVTVYNVYDLKNTTTNQDGYYSLTLNSDSVKIRFSQYPFVSKSFSLLLNNNMKLNVEMKENPLILPAFRVTSGPENQINHKPDEINLSSRNMKRLPFLFGETDVLKGLQLLPGISSGNDGTIGLNIRGGGPDQNLILLDDVPIYNPSHIYGFFSVFNSDVIKDVKLLKGGMSARYSGRLSSVIDVRTKDGNNKKITTQISAGLLSSKLTIDGPLGKNKKTTFILSGRRSFFDLFYDLYSDKNIFKSINPLRTGYYFYDANGKINHAFSDKHQIAFGFYVGGDNVFIRNSFTLKDPEKVIKEKDAQNVFWGNRVYSFRDHHVWTPKISGRLNISYSNYNFGNKSNYEYSESNDSVQLENSYNYEFESIIRNSIASYHLEAKVFDWLNVKSGVGGIYHQFERRIFSSDKIINQTKTENRISNAMEMNAYGEMLIKIRRNVEINAGLNASRFNLATNSYNLYQPRFSANYKLSKSMNLHAGYQKTNQFLHLLTSTNSGMPLDLWLPSTDKIKPEQSKMLSGGINFAKGDYIFNLEAFNKTMDGIIEYKDQANYIGSDVDWENKVTTGKGIAYGYEFLAEKRNGNTQGWISYTLSWNYRKFNDINGGKMYPYKYDRRHNFAFFVNHNFNRKIDASLSWVFTTGANYTLPEQVYYIGSGLSPQNVIYVYGERNNFKFPNYHRLDFGINFKKYHKRYYRIFSIGAYNVYNRLNPFYITPAYNQSGDRIFEAVSLFPVLPSINYKIQF